MGSSAQNSSGVHWCRRRVRFNEVPEKVPEKLPEKVWEAVVQSQVSFNRVPEKVLEEACQVRFRLWCKARSGSTGFWEALVQTQLRYFQRLASQHASERLVKIKGCGCWGYHRSLFWFC